MDKYYSALIENVDDLIIALSKLPDIKTDQFEEVRDVLKHLVKSRVEYKREWNERHNTAQAEG